jgi:hypothetical protein
VLLLRLLQLLLTHLLQLQLQLQHPPRHLLTLQPVVGSCARPAPCCLMPTPSPVPVPRAWNPSAVLPLHLRLLRHLVLILLLLLLLLLLRRLHQRLLMR